MLFLTCDDHVSPSGELFLYPFDMLASEFVGDDGMPVRETLDYFCSRAYLPLFVHILDEDGYLKNLGTTVSLAWDTKVESLT